MTAEASLIISWRYHQIMSFEGLAKLCFKSESTLVITQMAFVITNFNFWIQFGQFDFHPWKGQNFFHQNVQEKGRFSIAGRKTGPAEHSSLVDYLEKTISASFIAFSFEIGTPRKISGGYPRIPYVFSNDPFRWKNNQSKGEKKLYCWAYENPPWYLAWRK